MRIVQPLLFQAMMDYFSADSKMTLSSAAYYAVFMCLAASIQACAGPQVVINCLKTMFMWESAICSMIYKKVT